MRLTLIPESYESFKYTHVVGNEKEDQKWQKTQN